MPLKMGDWARIALRCGVAVSALTLGKVAIAQTMDQSQAADAIADEDIVVTGTLVRGIAPPGANVLSVDQEALRATGASTVAQLLQTIPQLGSFNSLQNPLAVSGEVAVNRPNLRNLPGFNTAGGSTTLVMLDGHRMVGMGISSTTPDPDVIPPGVVERLEIVPDGGSALYGSDAVAGVMNFVTIKRFDGVKVDGGYGFADDYYAWDANITAGKDWGSGSIYASYAYSKTDDILGKDRDYIKQYPSAAGYTSLQCEPGNIEALAGVFATQGSIHGVNGGAVTQCDSSDYATLYPKSERHSVLAGLTQQLDDSVAFELRGFYTNRKTHVEDGPYRNSQIITPFPIPGVPSISSPYSPFTFGGFGPFGPIFLPGSVNSVDLVQQVDFQIGPNNAIGTNIELDTWEITPSFTIDLNKNFELRVLGTYGESASNMRRDALNEPALQNAIVAGLINPYNVTTSNGDAIAAVTNFEEFSRTRQRFSNLRAVIDGDLFTLPGGAAKIAVGAEYYGERFITTTGQAVPGYEWGGYSGSSIGGTPVVPAIAGLPTYNVSRNVQSAFGELVLPVFGGTGRASLTLSAAGRYDHYSDFGDTFNPRFGATFKPFDWLTFRGAWGKSFNAPSLADFENASGRTLYNLTGASAAFFAPPAALQAANGGPYPNYNGGNIVALRGNAPGIEPQKATTWTVGFDLKPVVVPGIQLGLTYYNIRFSNLIGLAPFETPSLLYQNYPNLITTSPSQALLDAALATATSINGPTPLSAATTYAFLDARKRNLGDVHLDGIDFALSYRTGMSFGSLFFNANGTYALDRKRSSVPGGALVDVLSKNAGRVASRTSIGAEVGPVLGQLTWNHTGGYSLDPVVGYVPQDRVSSFDTIDLYFDLKVPGGGWARDLSLSLNVNNLLDEDPPLYRGPVSILGLQGITNGNTLGRYVKFGISKKF